MDAQKSEDVTEEPRLIKRYANRKLYDTKDSKYVTLHQIAEFVRRGEDVKIIDNKSKEDLTNVTLAQIIYEEEKKGESESRKSSLKSFIQEGREKLVGSLPAPLSKLLKEDERSPKEALDELKGLADERIRALVSSAMGTVDQLQGEVKRLQSRIEELEQKLASMVGRDKKDD